MINIIDSIHEAASITMDRFFEYLADAYEWKDVVTEDDSITRLYVTDKIYIKRSEDNKIGVCHTNGDSYTKTLPITAYNRITIVQTDNGIAFYPAASVRHTIAINKTTDVNGNESTGLVIDINGTWVVFTDNMYASPINATFSQSTSNEYITQLIPVCNPVGSEYFKNLLWVTIGNNTDLNNIILNNEYYYILNRLAIKYTN